MAKAQPSPEASGDIRRFLVKLTDEEKQARLERESEEHAGWLYVNKKAVLIDKDVERKRAAERQQKHREKVRAREEAIGLRDEDGKLIKCKPKMVCWCSE